MREEIGNLVRIGTVTVVDAGKRLARVKFQDAGITSGWLPVVQHYGAGLCIEPDEYHDHLPGSHVTYWMPGVNDTVLVLYLPVFNADGYILGGL